MEDEQLSLESVSAEMGTEAVEMWRPLEFNTELATIIRKTVFGNLFPLSGFVSGAGHSAHFRYRGFWTSYPRHSKLQSIEAHRGSERVQPCTLYGLYHDCSGAVSQADVLHDPGGKLPVSRW